DRNTVESKCDMHGPVRARRLGELAGAVERIDDPYPSLSESSVVVGGLLGEDGIGRETRRELLGEERLRTSVTGRLQGGALQPLGAYLQQQFTGCRRHLGRGAMVGFDDGVRCHRSGW